MFLSNYFFQELDRKLTTLRIEPLFFLNQKRVGMNNPIDMLTKFINIVYTL